MFPFGHGLSYTTFEYGKPTADSKTMQADGTLTVKVSVKNTGAREGQEVVQLYISDKKSSLPRPVKELKGFQKVKLAPGETKEVTFTIDKELLASSMTPSTLGWPSRASSSCHSSFGSRCEGNGSF